MATEYPRGDVKCVCGSGITTRLRCSRCGKPICYECMVESPVGFRCRDCSSGPAVAMYRTSGAVLLRAAGAGVAVALAIGFLWGNFPSWGFWMALLLGFGTAEAMAWAARYKRGGDLQVIAFGAMLIGLVVSRYTIAMVNPDNLPFDTSFSFVMDNLGQEAFRQIYYLRTIPDLIFMVIPFVIAYIRFK